MVTERSLTVDADLPGSSSRTRIRLNEGVLGRLR